MLSLFYSSRFLEKYSLQLLHVFSLREFLCCSLFLFSEKKLCSLSRWMTTFIVILSLYLLFIFLLYPLLDHGVICASFSPPPPQEYFKFHTHPPLSPFSYSSRSPSTSVRVKVRSAFWTSILKESDLWRRVRISALFTSSSNRRAWTPWKTGSGAGRRKPKNL